MKRRYTNDTKTITPGQRSTGVDKQKNLSAAKGLTSIRRINASRREVERSKISRSMNALSVVFEAKTEAIAVKKNLPRGFVRFNILMALAQKHYVASTFLQNSGLNMIGTCSLSMDSAESFLFALAKLVYERQSKDDNPKMTLDYLFVEIKELDIFGGEKEDEDDDDDNNGGGDEVEKKKEKEKEDNDAKAKIEREKVEKEIKRSSGLYVNDMDERRRARRMIFGKRPYENDNSDDHIVGYERLNSLHDFFVDMVNISRESEREFQREMEFQRERELYLGREREVQREIERDRDRDRDIEKEEKEAEENGDDRNNSMSDDDIYGDNYDGNENEFAYDDDVDVDIDDGDGDGGDDGDGDDDDDDDIDDDDEF